MKYVYDIRDFGAVGDGATLDTVAIQAAIDAAAQHGGRVVVPPGEFLTGTIVLKSRVTLELVQGGKLLGSPRLEDYIARTWGHHKDIAPWHLVLAEDAENVVITGEGEIDGNGPSFWQADRPHEWHFWREHVRRPSPMVELVRCRNVRVENVTLRNSAGWTLHLHDCDDSAVRGVTIRNTYFGPNTDGIDATGCHRLTISDCNIATGDDAIALKTTRYSRSCEYVAITNCVLQTSCVAVRLGFESHKAFRYITASNCVVPRSSRVIDLRSIEGGDMEHIVLSGITGTTNSGWPVNRPIEIVSLRCENLYDSLRPAEHQDKGQFDAVPAAGVLRDITLRDIDIVTDGRVMIVADKAGDIRDVVLDNVRLRYVLLDDPGRGGPCSASFVPGDHQDARAAKAAVIVKNARNLQVCNLAIHWPQYPVPDDWFLLSSPNRMIRRDFYEGSEEAIRSGEKRLAFRALWARGLDEGCIDLRGIRSSDGSLAADAADCTAEIVGGE